MHQHHRYAQTQEQAGHSAGGRPGQALAGDHGQHLAARQAQMGQQTELLAPRQHLRAKAGGHAKQANANGHRLQPVGHGKAAVEDAHRDGANLRARSHLDCRRLALRLHQLDQGLLQRWRILAWRKPQSQVVDAGVAADALVVTLIDHDGAELARVVAPDARHKKARRLARAARSKRGVQALEGLAHSRAVELDHRLADIHRHLPGGQGQGLADQGQAQPGLAEVARNQANRRQGRVEPELAHAQGVDAGHAGQLAYRLDQSGLKVNGVSCGGAGAAAQVDVGRQHAVEPLADREPKAADHHSQGHGQAERGDHATDGHTGALAHPAGPLDGQQRQQALAQQAFACGIKQLDQTRQRGDAAYEHQRHGGVGGQRHASNRRQQAQQAADRQQAQGPAQVAPLAARQSQPLERLRRCQRLGCTRGPPAAHARGQHAQRAIGQRSGSAPL